MAENDCGFLLSKQWRENQKSKSIRLCPLLLKKIRVILWGKCVLSINKNNRMEYQFVRLSGSILSSLFSGLTSFIFVYSDYWKIFFSTIYVGEGTTRSHHYHNSFMKNSTFRWQEIMRSFHETTIVNKYGIRIVVSLKCTLKTYNAKPRHSY